MIKKLIIIGLIILLLFLGIWYYNSQKTVECWWGVMYPSLSFIAIEDEEDYRTSQISTLDKNFIGKISNEEEPIKFGFAIIKFFDKYFK